MKTYISDNFPLNKLECQYFEICRSYNPKYCSFDKPCEIRKDLRNELESYVAIENLEFQIKLILDNHNSFKTSELE